MYSIDKDLQRVSAFYDPATNDFIVRISSPFAQMLQVIGTTSFLVQVIWKS